MKERKREKVREEKKKGKQEYLFCKILWAWGEEKRTAEKKNGKNVMKSHFFRLKTKQKM